MVHFQSTMFCELDDHQFLRLSDGFWKGFINPWVVELSAHWGNAIFKTWKSVESGCSHSTMMKCREITVEASLAGAVRLQRQREGRVVFIPAGADRWIGKCSTKSFFCWTILELKHCVLEPSPDLSAMSVCLCCRYVSDASDSYRCRWPHLRQQCPAGVQYTARTAVFLCGASDRWGWVSRHLHTKYRVTALVQCHARYKHTVRTNTCKTASTTQQSHLLNAHLC